MFNINAKTKLDNLNLKPTVIFETYVDNQRMRFKVTGQQARTLLALFNRGKQGVTALEISSWALRLAAYVHELKKRFDLAIYMEREPHPQGHHARYFLKSPVEIIDVSYKDC